MRFRALDPETAEARFGKDFSPFFQRLCGVFLEEKWDLYKSLEIMFAFF